MEESILKGIGLMKPGKPLMYLLNTKEGEQVVVIVMKLRKDKQEETKDEGGDLNIIMNEGVGSGEYIQ